MKKIILTTCIACALFSCQKENSVENGINTGNTGGTGSTGNGPTTSPMNNDYQPTTANSRWNLKSTTLGDYTITSLGTDTIINGKKYFSFNHSAGGGRQYISKENGEYRQFVKTPQVSGWTNLLYLKDGVVGTTWTETLSTAQGLSVLMKYTVESVGGTRTVNGKLYTNVIGVNYEQSVMGISTGTGKQWYSKGVGGIEGVSYADILGNVIATDSTYLVSAVIN